MEIRPREVRTYAHFVQPQAGAFAGFRLTPDGRESFQEWFGGLKDQEVRSAVLACIDRLRSGNFGDYRRLTGDLYELRIHYGAGYRVYFGDIDGETVILLCGGSKRTQKRDIQKATEYWEEFRRRPL